MLFDGCFDELSDLYPAMPPQQLQQQQQQQQMQQMQQLQQLQATLATVPSSSSVKAQLKSKLKSQQARKTSSSRPPPVPVAAVVPVVRQQPATLAVPTSAVKEEAGSDGYEDEDEDDEDEEDEDADERMDFGGASSSSCAFDPNETFVAEALAFDSPHLEPKLEQFSPSYPISPPSTSSSPTFGGDSPSHESDSSSSAQHSPLWVAGAAPTHWHQATFEQRIAPSMTTLMDTWPAAPPRHLLPGSPGGLDDFASHDPQSKNPKRSSHNAIERRYRDNINHKIIELRNAVPSSDHDEKLNKGKVLKRATDYIYYLCGFNNRLKEENTKLREMLLSVGAGEMLKRYDNAVISRERAELEKAEKLEEAKSKKKKEPRQSKAKLADGVRVFVIAGACVSLFYGLPFAGSAAAAGGTFHSRVLESATDSAATTSSSFVDYFLQSGLEYVAWFALRFLLLTLGLFSVLLGDPITSVDSEDFASSMEKTQQGQVSAEQGNLQVARQLLGEGLSLLGRPLPVSFNDQFFGFTWQLFRQVSHFLLVGFWLDRLMAQRSAHSRNSYKQAAHLHFRLLQLDLAAYDPQTLDHLARLTNTLAAVSLMEAAEVDSAVLARVYASAALLLRLSLPIRLRFLSRYYLNLARKELQASPSETDPSLTWLSSSAGYRFFMGDAWTPALTEPSAALPKGPVDPLLKFARLFHQSLLLSAFSSLSKEGASTSLRLFEDVSSSAARSGDKSSLWWATVGQASCHWKLDQAARGDERLLAADQIFRPESRLQLAFNYASFGRMLARQGKVVLAMRAIDQATSLLESNRSNSTPEFSVCAADGVQLDPIIEAICSAISLDIRVSAWQALQAEISTAAATTTTDEELVAAASQGRRQALQELIKSSQKDLDVLKRSANRLARKATYATLFVYKGITRALMEGSAPRTRSLFEKALKIAQEDGNSFLEGLVLKSQVRFCQTTPEERRKQLKQAAFKFQEVEAREDVRLTEALLAH